MHDAEQEHYADPNDYASAVEQAATSNALSKVTRYTLPKDFDGTCECGEAVHPERIRLGLSNCIGCAEEEHARSRMFRR